MALEQSCGCQLIPGERPLKLNLFYQSLSGGVFCSQKCVVLTFCPSVNSSMVRFSMLCSQPYFPNMHITNGCALCKYSAAVSPEESGLGASSTLCNEELEGQGQSFSALGLSTESVHDTTWAE